VPAEEKLDEVVARDEHSPLKSLRCLVQETGTQVLIYKSLCFQKRTSNVNVNFTRNA
jgi:hypothetical protein